MESWGLGRRIGMGVIWAIGLGMLAGGMETVALAASEKLSLGLVGFGMLGVVDALLMGLLAALFGVITSPIPFVLRESRPSTASALHLTAVGFLLCGWYLWQGAYAVWIDGRGAIGAGAMASMPLGFAGVIYFNARFFLRRLEIGKPMGLPWLPAAAAGSLALVGLSAVFHAFRDTGGPHALPDDRNVVVVTIDGWGHGEPPTALPGATTFENTISPAPYTRPGAATVLTGLHPLRHRVIDAERTLSWSYISIAEMLEQEGYATGAFVSSWDVNADSGLEQGFRVYDDDFSPVVGGLFRINLLKPLGQQLKLGRSGAATVDRFEGWLDEKAEHPFLAWVQLPAEADSAALVERIDGLLSEHGVTDETLLIVTGLRGEPRRGGPDGLYDDTVHVSMIVRAPGIASTTARVPHQVRLMDIAGSALGWLGIDQFQTEGIDLLAYLDGRASATVWCSLVGPSPDGSGWRVGLRNNGVKYLKDRATGTEELYHVETDPQETDDLKASQEKTLTAARQMLASEEVALDKILR